MVDKSFTNLLIDKNLNRIRIDQELIESFKRVINTIQVYFNVNGYTSQRNYANFFEKYLLQDTKGKLYFQVSDEPSKFGAHGFYRMEKDGKNIIVIDKSVLKMHPEYIDSVLCHEFIHFLVMRELKEDKMADPQIKNGGFINEALTQMLTELMYPNVYAYKPQTSMMKFVNLLTNNVNNYSLFLRGRIDSRGYGSSSWENFVINTSLYQNKWDDKGFRMHDAIIDELYLNAQRNIISANIHPHLIRSFKDYEKWISILGQRPAPDLEWTESFIQDMDHFLIRNMKITNFKMQELFLKYLKEYRDISLELSKYNGEDVVEVEISGQRLAVNKGRKIYNSKDYSASWNPSTGLYKISIGNENIMIDMNHEDFSKRRRELLERKQDISKYFTKTLLQDIKTINGLLSSNNLLKLERFQLPIIGERSKASYVYVAIYKDKIKVLNSAFQLGKIENVHHSKYIGITSLKSGAIYAERLGKISTGIVCSTLNTKQLEVETIKYIQNQISKSLTREQLQYVIEQYRNSDKYDLSDEKNIEDLKRFALEQISKEKFLKLSEQEKNNISQVIIQMHSKIVISTKKGEVDVSILFGTKHLTAFKGNREILIDTQNRALWNEYYEIFRGNNNLAQTFKGIQSIMLDKNGDIMYSTYENNAKSLQYHQAIIKQVEKLLSTKITSINRYVVDPNRFGGIPQILIKDIPSLSKERDMIIQKLNALYYDGQLDMKMWQNMKKEISIEYDHLILNAQLSLSDTYLQEQNIGNEKQTSHRKK